MLKIYDKPSLTKVASLQKFTAAYASYCDLVPSALELPEECERPDN